MGYRLAGCVTGRYAAHGFSGDAGGGHLRLGHPIPAAAANG